MIIGLTGGIGSGKSTVSKLFETMNCPIYNSDEKAKDLYFKPSIKSSIINLLGQEAYLNEKEINKTYISKKVFSDDYLLQQLNQIIHPAVKEDFTVFKNKYASESIIIKETALLFETDIYKEVTASILVTAPVYLKIERVQKRNSLPIEEVEKRMKAQWSDEQKIPLADFIVNNDGDTAIIPQVLSILKKLTTNA